MYARLVSSQHLHTMTVSDIPLDIDPHTEVSLMMEHCKYSGIPMTLHEIVLCVNFLNLYKNTHCVDQKITTIDGDMLESLTASDILDSRIRYMINKHERLDCHNYTDGVVFCKLLNGKYMYDFVILF